MHGYRNVSYSSQPGASLKRVPVDLLCLAGCWLLPAGCFRHCSTKLGHHTHARPQKGSADSSTRGFVELNNFQEVISRLRPCRRPFGDWLVGLSKFCFCFSKRLLVCWRAAFWMLVFKPLFQTIVISEADAVIFGVQNF